MSVISHRGPKTQIYNEKLKSVYLVLLYFLSLYLAKHVTHYVMKPKVSNVLANELTMFQAKYSQFSRNSNPFDAATTEKRLNHFFPYSSPNKTAEHPLIPKVIYQFPDLPIPNAELPYNEDLKKRWRVMNPNYELKTFAHEELDELIRDTFEKTVPEIYETYINFPHDSLKSDFARYLILFLNGGIYADLNLYTEVPIDSWFDSNRELGFVTGLDFDENDNWNGHPTRVQFSHWFFKTEARHPILSKLISDIVRTGFNSKIDSRVPRELRSYRYESKCSFKSDEAWTGGQKFTEVIYYYLNTLNSPTVVDLNPLRKYDHIHGPDRLGNGAVIDYNIASGLFKPLVIGDVLIYPQRTFRNGKDCDDWCYLNKWSS